MRLNVWPVHTGEFAVKLGAGGLPNTLTLNVPLGPVQPPTVALTEYIPVATVPAPVMEGFWVVELKPLGPLQLYAAPVMLLAVRFMVDPTHKVEVPPVSGAAGVGLITTLTVPALLVQPLTICVTEYVPAAFTVGLKIVGF